ncbi:MAG: NADH-quinone oxidoreductase subunit NuoG [Acidimicrobiaceae bacterium]|nr:NADH-quinone oxidoreductase subunit NuoG [Acidimicrobiaceae bacterium]
MTDVARTSVSISVNGRSFDAKAGELLIEAAERSGTYIPRFCYHPRMEPVGVCRMCLVEVEGPRGATLQPACYIKVAEGMSVVTDSEKVKKAQDGVLEFLLANHPLDCPICDKGGECPLQDQTLAHGSGETRFVEEKRHFVKPISIGELVLLDRERCIQCSRCTRFASEVAGEAQIAFSGRGDLIEVAPSPTQPFDSVFSGNTVQICPVGALTAKPYRFSARPWDLDQVESTCTTCAVGCRVAVQSSGNRLTRVLGVDSDPVNHGWLCDKGRFTLDSIDGNESSSDPLSAATRIKEPLVRRDGVLSPVSWGVALAEAARLLERASHQPGGVGAIGGAALTNEGAFAWQRLVRDVLHSENIDAQYGDGLDAALIQALPRATIDEAANARTLVTLCGDLREELPVLFLRLRENVVRQHNSIVELSFGASALRSVATVSLAVRAGEAHVVAQALGRSGGGVPQGAAFSEDDLLAARRLIGESGEGVVFVVGRANLAERAPVIESAVRYLAERFPDAKFLPALRRSNVVGALDMGLSPQLRPGRGFDPGSTGRDCAQQLAALSDGSQRALLLLGGCLLGNVLDVVQASAALERADVVVVTGHGGATLAYADVVLPAAVQHERTGTVTNIEGRVTSVVPKIVAPGSAWPDVAIAAELAELLGQSLGLDSIEMAAKAIEESTGYPALSVLNDATDGVVVGRHSPSTTPRPLDPMANPGIRSVESAGLGALSGATTTTHASSAPSPASATLELVGAGRGVEVPLVDAYSLRLNLSRRLYDQGIAVQGSAALANLTARAVLHLNHFDLDRLGVVTGDLVTMNAARGAVRLPVELDDSVPRGCVEVPFGSLDESGVDVVRPVLDAGAVVTSVRLESR